MFFPHANATNPTTADTTMSGNASLLALAWILGCCLTCAVTCLAADPPPQQSANNSGKQMRRKSASFNGSSSAWFQQHGQFLSNDMGPRNKINDIFIQHRVTHFIERFIASMSSFQFSASEMHRFGQEITSAFSKHVQTYVLGRDGGMILHVDSEAWTEIDYSELKMRGLVIEVVVGWMEEQ